MKESVIRQGIQHGDRTTELLVGRVVYAQTHIIHSLDIKADGDERIGSWYISQDFNSFIKVEVGALVVSFPEIEARLGGFLQV